MSKNNNNNTAMHPAGLVIVNKRLHLVISIELIGTNFQFSSYLSPHITLKFTFLG